MISRTRRSFWDRHDRLPETIKQQARVAFRQFCADPAHPGLRFHPLRGYEDHWSARVTLSYRAVGIRDGDTITWIWIGSHADFDAAFP